MIEMECGGSNIGCFIFLAVVVLCMATVKIVKLLLEHGVIGG